MKRILLLCFFCMICNSTVLASDQTYADQFWEFVAPHKIYERQQVYIPQKGWQFVYGATPAEDSAYVRYTGRNAAVEYAYQTIGFCDLDLHGNRISQKQKDMYKYFGIYHEASVIFADAFFSHENLSRTDHNGFYVLDNTEIANRVCSIQNKRVKGPVYCGEDSVKDSLLQWLRTDTPTLWGWDRDTLRYGGGFVSWTPLMWEGGENPRQYQILQVNGVTLDGKGDKPYVFRYGGGVEKNVVQSQPKGILSLMYHQLTQNVAECSPFTLHVDRFEQDIRYLTEQGYTFIFASQTEAFLAHPEYGAKYVLITFDDGYPSDVSLALPVLEKYGARATFYIVGSFADRLGRITEDHIRTLSASPNAEVGCHGYDLHNFSYKDIKKLVMLHPDVVAEDFLRGKAYLERVTGKAITTVSYPNGLYSAELDALLKNAGITVTFSTHEGRMKHPFWVHHRINRGTNRVLADLIYHIS